MNFRSETLGYRLILKPYIEKESKGGIIIARDDRTQAINTDRGEVLMIGPEAWKSFKFERNPVEVGDKVFYAKYGAKTIKDEETGEFYILCNDEDILVGYTNE